MTVITLRCELEEVVGIQIQTEPYSNDDGEHQKSCAVFNERKEGKQKNPEGEVIHLSNEGERVHESLLNGGVVGGIFSKPCEPHGGVAFEHQSVKHPDHRESDHPTSDRPKRGGEGVNNIDKGGKPKPQCEPIIPAHSQEFILGHRVNPFLMVDFQILIGFILSVTDQNDIYLYHGFHVFKLPFWIHLHEYQTVKPLNPSPTMIKNLS
jgi:hypothetical protein